MSSSKLIGQSPRRHGIAAALGAALLFGATTPFAKQLLRGIQPLPLAGLMYLGSGIGLAAIRLVRDRGWRDPGIARADWPWLAAAVAVGGVLAPVLLMVGLERTSAAMGSLLLNLEAVLTALLAWLLFREHAGVRVVLGMTAIAAGAALLSWPGLGALGADRGALAIVGACACWAIDNNLTRKVSTGDAPFIAGVKGWIAGLVNLGLWLAFAGGAPAPSAAATAGALLVGFAGFGVSLVLYVVALRELGSSRTGAYFATAPFIGAALAIGLYGERATAGFYAAAALMGIGVWLHLSERHDHEHIHDESLHTHPHVHDEHHRHAHPGGWDGAEPHSHAHRHGPLRHAHPHYPDAHHRHPH
ncbi:MAG TPA: EamA family transporter [Steroidobacteraceae bacterium]|nr:EamA family transporter [Steroidobacteraceae bacterium]